ncbi:glycosyltransferase family 4 protein [Pantoea sp. B65]|uniref:glycosyltransferase family 4 protein n=1 Tax=Pantoea sp. B65 TaxID=2813359 RepID=UPI0039B5FD0A
MKIAQIAPLNEAVPPVMYGGTERIVAVLADTLVRKGHDVTLFASGDSHTLARLHVCRDRALRLDPTLLKSALAAHFVMFDELQQRAGEFDVLHFHTDILHFPFFERIAAKTLTTLHGRLDISDLPAAFRRWWQYPLVSISDAQREPLPGANWAGTVWHGLDPAHYTFTATPRAGYLAFLGRISPEKRPDRAIAIARQAGIPLQMAAKVDDVDKHYFRQVIKPLLTGGGVEFIGEISDRQKADFLGQACALLFPIDWPEPFGLVMIEAMACGTPVIAWRRGSVAEIIEPGITGSIVENEAQAVAACREAAALDRYRVRARFERRFSASAMAEDYLQLYRRLLPPAANTEALDLQA